MATHEFIKRAQQALEHRVLELRTILDMCSDLAGEESPSWLWVVRNKFIDVDEAAHGYMEVIHEHAMPVLTDYQRVISHGQQKN